MKKLLLDVECGRIGRLNENDKYEFEIKNISEKDFNIISEIISESEDFYEMEDGNMFVAASQETINKLNEKF